MSGSGASGTPRDAYSALDDARGQVALVTGSAGGLGRAIVAALVRDGYSVVAATHRGGPWAADLGDPGACLDLVARVVDRHARLDVLVANAATMAMGPVDALDVEAWWKIVDVNLGGAFRLARAAAPHLGRSPGGGRIVLVSSEWGVTGWRNASAYAASKAGMIGLARALAIELAPGVRTNAVAPGVIDTPQLAVDASDAGMSLDEVRARYADVSPLRRIAAAAEIAETIAFLVSPRAAYYTGQTLHPNGGTTTV